MTVVHSSILSNILRNSHSYYGLSGVLRGHTILLTSSMNTLNILSAFHNLYNFCILLLRTRDSENIPYGDYLSYDPNIYQYSYSMHDSGSDDIEIDSHINIEHDLTCFGLSIYGSLCDIGLVTVLRNISILNYFIFIPNFLNIIHYLFNSTMLYIYFFVSIFIIYAYYVRQCLYGITMSYHY